MNPPVALLVPAHNAARFLPRLWASVRAQTTPFAECLVYDDASTDDTAAVARSLGATVLAGSVNLGPAAGRNALLEATSCAWVHFHDADDTLHPDFVTRMAGRARAEDSDVVLCQVDWLDEASGETVLRWRYRDDTYRSPHAPAEMIVNIIGGIGGLYRTSHLRAIGGFRRELRFWEDLDLHLRLWRNGARFHVLDEVLSFACRHAGSTSNSGLTEVWRAKTALLEELRSDPTHTPVVIAAIGREAETIMQRQFNLGDTIGARMSFDLARRAGVEVPSTASSSLAIVQRLFGRWPAARFQHRVRRLAHRLARNS